jgi:hypothetical protein
MNEQAPKKQRTWIWVVLGVFVVLFVLAVGGIFFAVSFFRQSMSVTEVSASTADDEFDAVRARFAGQQPLIQFVDERPQLIDDPGRQTTAGKPLTTMHLMAWDDREAKLVRLAVPFWLLRLKSGPIQLSAYSQGWNDHGVSFRVEDIEKHGPGLLLDVNERSDGGRVLIWAE